MTKYPTIGNLTKNKFFLTMNTETTETPVFKGATRDQYEILEIWISHFWGSTIRAKKAILWFLRQSDYLSKDIVTSFPYKNNKGDDYAFAQEVAFAVHDMLSSSNQPFELSDIFKLMQCPKHLSSHCGFATQQEANITIETGWDSLAQKSVPVKTNGFTIWLSKEMRQKENILLIQPDMEAIAKTKLRRNRNSGSTDGNPSHIGVPEFYEENTIPKIIQWADQKRREAKHPYENIPRELLEDVKLT